MTVPQARTGSAQSGIGFAVGWWLALTFVLALAVRLWGIGWQLPEALYSDELKYVSWASESAQGDGPERTDFRNSSLFRHLLRLEYEVSDRLTFNREPQEQATQHLLLARVTSAVLGAGAAVFVALAALTIFSAPAGILAGLLLALSPLHVHLSHLATNDVPASFFLCVALYASARVLSAPSARWVLAAGAFAGLAAAAKYNFGAVVLLPLVALGLRARHEPQSWRRPVLFIGLTLLGFVAALILAMPEIALSPQEVLDGMRRQARIGQRPWQDQPDSPVAQLYVEAMFRGVGLLGAAVALVGAVLVARERPSVALALLVCPFVYLAVMLRSNLFFARFALPLIPFAVMFAGVGILGVAKLLRGPRAKTVTLSIVAVFVTVTAPLVRDVVHHNTLAMATDTRVLARDWVSAHAQGALVATQSDGLPPPWVGSESPDGVETTVFKAFLDPDMFSRLACDNARFVMLSSAYSYRDSQDRRYSRPDTGYTRLRQNAKLVATFSPYRDGVTAPAHPDDRAIPIWHLHAYERPGPQIEVYELSETAYESCRRARSVAGGTPTASPRH